MFAFDRTRPHSVLSIKALQWNNFCWTLKCRKGWARWYPKSPASRLFTQPFIQAQIKENIKAPRHWPLWGNSPVTDEFPAQRSSYGEYVFIWWRHHDFTLHEARPLSYSSLWLSLPCHRYYCWCVSCLYICCHEEFWWLCTQASTIHFETLQISIGVDCFNLCCFMP